MTVSGIYVIVLCSALPHISVLFHSNLEALVKLFALLCMTILRCPGLPFLETVLEA